MFRSLLFEQDSPKVAYYIESVGTLRCNANNLSNVISFPCN
jgi:hypothetical protein